jgi:hypothetical protein
MHECVSACVPAGDMRALWHPPGTRAPSAPPMRLGLMIVRLPQERDKQLQNRGAGGVHGGDGAAVPPRLTRRGKNVQRPGAAKAASVALQETGSSGALR